MYFFLSRFSFYENLTFFFLFVFILVIIVGVVIAILLSIRIGRIFFFRRNTFALALSLFVQGGTVFVFILAVLFLFRSFELRQVYFFTYELRACQLGVLSFYNTWFRLSLGLFLFFFSSIFGRGDRLAREEFLTFFLEILFLF